MIVELAFVFEGNCVEVEAFKSTSGAKRLPRKGRMFIPAVFAAKALICGLLFGMGEPVPFREEQLFWDCGWKAEVFIPQAQ